MNTEPTIGDNSGDIITGTEEVNPGHLKAYIERIEAIDDAIDRKQAAQKALVSAIDCLRWPNGFRGKDGRRLRSPTDRFFDSISFDLDGCWEWTGSHVRAGYGLFNSQNKSNGFSHRYMAEHVSGQPIPRGLVVDHLCRNPRCSNPVHLEIVTQSENVRRGKSSEGLRAFQKAKTHCPHGHPYSGDNLYVFGNGFRACRLCAWRRRREYESRKRARQ